LKRIGHPNPEFETKHKDRNSDLRLLQKKDSLEEQKTYSFGTITIYTCTSFKRKVKSSSYFKQGVQSSR
jgi:hypothetical protein